MTDSWTFAQKVGAALAVIVVLALSIAGVATYALRTVVTSKDRVITVNAQNVIDAERLHVASARKGVQSRAYLLTRDPRYLTATQVARDEFRGALGRLKTQVSNEESKHLLDQIEKLEADQQVPLEALLALRATDTPLEVIATRFEKEVATRREKLDLEVDGFVKQQEKLLDERRRAATATAEFATTLVFVAAGVALFSSLILAWTLSQTLARQISGAVQQVQSASAELQAASGQQATGAKEQASAMSEISTTISELLATSRQIAESAQRVAQIAADTAAAARVGDQTVQRSNESMTATRRQIDLVVGHMLDLGKRTQQIGGVLEIINELAEQTNILAINATIEAAGAGDAGKRFGVVAEEIRRLADRVTGSTKEIRGLVDDVRSAANTTVMSTEMGSKAVDAGARQFGETATSFKQIGSLVGTTMEAAREIELSTKQQTTAVEQVNVAIASVAQATKEAEASAGQALLAASQLASMSRDLTRLIKPVQ
jgi:methyl-accepting chemotaxis protein